MKQANVPAPSRVVTDDRDRDAFEHQGHRTAVSQRALQARADPWLGWCELRGVGQVVTEVSPYEEDLDWDDVTEPEETAPLLYSPAGQPRRSTASRRRRRPGTGRVPGRGGGRRGVDGHVEAFAAALAEFGASYGPVARDDHLRFVDAFRAGEIPGVEAI